MGWVGLDGGISTRLWGLEEGRYKQVYVCLLLRVYIYIYIYISKDIVLLYKQRGITIFLLVTRHNHNANYKNYS